MASISVDVDLDDFELDEILDELESRYNSYRSKEKNQKEINAFIKRMKIDCEENDILNLSLLDKIKIDFLMQNLNDIKLNDLENLINK
jgi:hypothetical protein